jgi:hypothetical protein
VKVLCSRCCPAPLDSWINFFSQNHSGDVNIDSGLGRFSSPFGPGIDIHIASESVFTSPRNFYSHAPEFAPTDGIYVGMFPRVKDEVKENAERVHRILTKA